MEFEQQPLEPGRMDTTYFTRLQKISGVTQTDGGLLARLDDELLRVDVIREDILRIKISRGGVFDEEPTFAVSTDLTASAPHFSFKHESNRVILRTPQISLIIQLHPFSLEAYRADGSTIFESARDQSGNPWAYATLNDEFVVFRQCRQEDAIYGLGEKTGHLNRKGEDYTLWNTDVLNPTAIAPFKAARAENDPRRDERGTFFDPYYISIPFFHHLTDENNLAAGFFIDNGYRAYFDFSTRNQFGFRFFGGQYTEYIFAGPGMDTILEGYTWLTGRMQAPPLWALGYHQCRWHPYHQKNFEDLADKIRQHNIPCDALWLDIDYMNGYRVFTWNKGTFQNAPGMLGRLREDGFRAITIIDPGVKYEPGYSVYDSAVEKDVLCKTESGSIYIGQVWPGKTAFPDFATQEAREWWGDLNAAHVQSGLAGIWNDMNEPATGEILPDAMRFDKGRASHARYHNQYALLMAMGTTDGLLRAMPGKRTFVLSRAGFSGIQRYAANWMGDNVSRWDHLWMSMPMGMGLGLSGQPFNGADIGGFDGNTNAELLLRWTQSGALVPFCRNHNCAGNIDQYPWSFGKVYEDPMRAALELRYRLLPYIYTAFIHSTETGAPVQQAMIFAFQNDATLRNMEDEYMFGPNLLVAPVYAPGLTARQVYLPEGAWYDWHSDECISGRRFITANLSMDTIPLYARAGAIIPMWPAAPSSTQDYHPETIELHAFIPQTDGLYLSSLQEDDGLTFKYGEGACYRTSLSLGLKNGNLSIQASVRGNGYAEFARKSFTLVFHGAMPNSIELDGKPVHPQNGRFILPNRGTSFTLKARLP